MIKIALLAPNMEEAWAGHVYDKLVKNIKTNKFKMPALNPRYLRWKKKHGLSTKILIATGEYIDSIMVKKVGRHWWVGIPKDLMHSQVDQTSESDLLMADLAKILEHGSPSRGIPARPVWALTEAEQGRDFNRWAFNYARKILSEMAGLNVGGGRGGHRWLTMSNAKKTTKKLKKTGKKLGKRALKQGKRIGKKASKSLRKTLSSGTKRNLRKRKSG